MAIRSDRPVNVAVFFVYFKTRVVWCIFDILFGCIFMQYTSVVENLSLFGNFFFNLTKEIYVTLVDRQNMSTYITLQTILNGLNKSNFKSLSQRTMSGYDCRNRWVFSFWQNVVSDRADWTPTGTLFQSRGPAASNERSPTVTHRDGRTSRRLEVDERSRPRRLDGRSATYRSWLDRYLGAVPWRAR